MAHCINCGTMLAAGANFCQNCGTKQAAGRNLESPSADGVDASESPPERIRDHQAAGSRRQDSKEEELWSGRYSAKAMAGTMMLAAAASAAAIAYWIVQRALLADVWWLPALLLAAIWLYIAGLFAYRRWNVRYRLTNQRFFHERGILRRVVDRIEVIDMDDITYVQRLVDRFFNVGVIRISSSDRTHPELQLVGIDRVKDVAALIDSARRAERVRRGLHIEQI